MLLGIGLTELTPATADMLIAGPELTHSRSPPKRRIVGELRLKHARRGYTRPYQNI